MSAVGAGGRFKGAGGSWKKKPGWGLLLILFGGSLKTHL